jgi:hypothetical protein
MLYDPNWKPAEKPISEIKKKGWRSLLLRAAEAIENDGWTRKVLFNDDGRMCIIGAMHYADTGKKTDVFSKRSPTFRNAKQMLEMYIRNTYGGGSITHYNDYRAKSKQQVIKTIKAAANI